MGYIGVHNFFGYRTYQKLGVPFWVATCNNKFNILGSILEPPCLWKLPPQHVLPSGFFSTHPSLVV